MAGWYYHDGQWTDTNPKLTGPADHAFWLSSVVFDGARAFNGLAPDLDLHCQRAVESARKMLLAPAVSAAEIVELCRTGIRKFPRSAELYVRPMFYAEEGFLLPVAESTRFVLAIYEQAMPAPKGFSAMLSSRRRPAPDMAPTDAKASCLYPNVARAMREAQQKGYDNAVMLDANGNVAEFASANLWIVRDGVAMTPAINGTFLNGITRQRVLALLRGAGIAVEERTLAFADVLGADEAFSTGNYGKVQPVGRIQDRDFQPGPVYQKARDLYFAFAQKASVF